MYNYDCFLWYGLPSHLDNMVNITCTCVPRANTISLYTPFTKKQHLLRIHFEKNPSVIEFNGTAPEDNSILIIPRLIKMRNSTWLMRIYFISWWWFQFQSTWYHQRHLGMRRFCLHLVLVNINTYIRHFVSHTHSWLKGIKYHYIILSGYVP